MIQNFIYLHHKFLRAFEKLLIWGNGVKWEGSEF